MLLHRRRHAQVFGLGHVGNRAGKEIPLGTAGNFRRCFSGRLGQTTRQCLQPLQRLPVGLLRVPSHPRLHDEPQGTPGVVENQKLLHECETGVGHAEVVLPCHAHGRLEITDGLKSEESHRTPLKRGGIARPRLHRAETGQHRLHLLEGIRMLRSPLLHLSVGAAQADPSLAELHHGGWAGTDKRVTTKAPGRLRALQQKGCSARLGRELQVGGNGGFRIRQDFPADGNQVSPARQFQECFFVGVDHGVFGGRTRIPCWRRCRFTSGTVSSPK